MGKILKPLLVVAAVAVLFIPGVGQALAPVLYSLGVAAGTAVSLTAAIATLVTTMGISAAFSMASSALGLGPKKPEISRASYDRLYANIDPGAARKWAFGETAMSTDIHYHEWTSDGEDDDEDHGQDYLHEIVTVASHKVTSFKEIHFDDKLAWTAAGGVQGDYVGYLTLDTRLEGSAANVIEINGGETWGSTRRMTGLAYVQFLFRIVSRDPDDKPYDSPFSSSVPSRMTIIGEGCPVYDPRFDSTRGGSGSQRADNQATWAYSTGSVASGRNPALQLLTYLLGWQINGLLALGRGIPPDRFDIASFITAANACDEPVSRSAGGTEPRYRADGVFSEADDPGLVIETLLVSMNAVLRDVGGALSLTVISNDLSTPRFHFNDDDVLDGVLWEQTPGLDKAVNIVRGKFVSPDTLYQFIDYPQITLTAVDGLERIHSLDLALVQSPSQAQRIAKQMLERLQYQGRLSCELNHRAWAVQVGDPIELTFTPLGFGAKKFRVAEHTINPNGVSSVVLQEEHPAIYQWDATDAPPVLPASPTFYDPNLDPWHQWADTIQPGSTRNVNRGDWALDQDYLVGDFVHWTDGAYYECILAHHSDALNAPPNPTYWRLFINAIPPQTVTGRLTKPVALLPATTAGTITSYEGAAGIFQIIFGELDVSDEWGLTTQIGGNPQGLTVVYGPGCTYSVEDGFDAEEETAELTMVATGTGDFSTTAPLIGVFQLGKIKASPEEDTEAPDPPAGLALTSTVTTSSNGEQRVQLKATWTANSESDLAFYTVFLKEASGSFIPFQVDNGYTEYKWDVLPATLYTAKMSAVDWGGNVSEESAEVTHTTTADAVAPSAPTALACTAIVRSFFLEWTNPTANDLAWVDIYENTTNTTVGATKIARVGAASGQDGATMVGSYATGTTRYFFLKAVDTSGNESAFSSGASSATAAIVSGDMVANTIAGDRILANSMAAAKLTVTGTASLDALPTGITIGVSGTTLGTVDTRASDPLTRANALSTLLLPGLIQVSGSTTLADWRTAGDLTRINGGMISANTILLNSAVIGLRGVNFQNIVFTFNSPATNQVSWATGGTISYVDDAGANQIASISAGSATWSSGTLYLYWTKGATTISSNTSASVARTANTIVLALYAGGFNLNVTFGRTLIQNDWIKTDTIDANKLNVLQLDAVSANIGTLKTASSGARVEISDNLIEVFDASNVRRVRMGVW